MGILGVSQDASPDEVTRAYRQRALAEHPDKGGDKDRFDELAKAYTVLDDAKKREAYNEELRRQREREELVQNAPSTTSGTFSKQQAQEPMREKTKPTAGSKRQGKMRASEPGKPGACAHEWKGLGSAAGMLKMIEDQNVTPEQKTEKIFEEYAKLPRGKEKKREWVSGLRGQDKQALKALAKEKEKEAMAKMQGWLSTGPKPRGAGIGR